MLARSLAYLMGTVVALAVPAAAEAAFTAASVNLRSGPGTDYGVILTLPPGAFVAVHYCQPSWCSVTAGGYDGWVSASYIGGGGPYASAEVYPAYPPPPPPVYIAPGPYVHPGPYVYPRLYRPRASHYYNYGYRGW